MNLFETEEEGEVEALHAATALYTTESVVEALLDKAGWPDASGRLLDPGCGDGAFMCRALARLAPEAGDHAAADRVTGWEIHPRAALDARRAYAATLVGLGWGAADAEAAAGRNVRQADFVVGARDAGRFTHVVGNPPYLRWANLPPGLATLYEAVVARHALGDLAHAFLDACADMLEPDGVVAFVTADRWLFNETASRLRAEVGRRLGIADLGRLDPATTFYRPKRRQRGTPPRVHPVAIVLRTVGTPGLRALTGAPVPPDGGPDDAHDGPRLGEVATVRLAPWLGPEGIFVVDAGAAVSLTGADLVPVIDTDDIDSSTGEMSAPRRVAIRTTRSQRPSDGVMAHLERTLHRMPARGRGGISWMPPESMTLPLGEPALLVPRIVRTIRPTRLPAGICPINHNLHVVGAPSAGVSLDDIDRMLRGESTAAWVARFAPRLENGFHDMRAGVLRRVPVHAA